MPRSPDSATELAALDLLEASMRLEAGQREAYITSRDDLLPAVRERALELLLSDRDALAALQTGAAGSALYGADEVAPDIPGYRIIRMLGRGGMGSVWLAERDGRDFDHEVAIKVVRPGVLSESLVERFRRERQILAQLNHPHIARLYDGGQTDEGQPYIVMEHVPGQTLRAWLAQDPPPAMPRKLDLFRQVATAVGFAHQNLIVHRDLTPGNVLVDAGDQAKLIDFGIARPHRENGERTQPSRITGLSLTPGYAAPERARGEASNTLSDIFSLGRILSAMLGEGAPVELAAIAAKAAAHEPVDRYPAVSDLIDDIDRYRDGRTVPAFSTSRRYRVRKFVRRQRGLVVSITGLVLALALGMAGTTWSYFRAEDARARAEQRFGEVRELAKFMLYDLYDALEPITGNTKSLTMIADRASSYLDTLARERDADPALALETANGFKRLSDVLGNPEGANLGQREAAGVALKRAVAMLEKLHRDDPANIQVTRSLARALYSRSVYVFIAEDDSQGAIAPAQRSAKLFARVAASPGAKVEDRVMILEARLQAAKPLVWLDQGMQAVADMETLSREAAELAREYPRNLEVRKTQARTNVQLASAMSWTYDLKDQLAEYRTALPVASRGVVMYRRLAAAYPSDRTVQFGRLTAIFTRALIYYDLEDWSNADRDFTELEQLGDAMLARDPDDSDVARRLQTYRSQHAPILIELGRKAEGIAMARRVLTERAALLVREPSNPGYRRDHASAQAFVGETLMLAGDKTGGCRAYRDAEASWREIARRVKIDPLIQANDIDPIEKTVTQCRADGLL